MTFIGRRTLKGHVGFESSSSTNQMAFNKPKIRLVSHKFDNITTSWEGVSFKQL